MISFDKIFSGEKIWFDRCAKPDYYSAEIVMDGIEQNFSCFEELGRPLDKSVYWKTIFFISHPKHMLWVLKRTVSMRQFF